MFAAMRALLKKHDTESRRDAIAAAGVRSTGPSKYLRDWLLKQQTKQKDEMPLMQWNKNCTQCLQRAMYGLCEFVTERQERFRGDSGSQPLSLHLATPV